MTEKAGLLRRVVITGIGAVTPLALGREATWERLVAGESGVGPISAFDASALPTRIAAEVSGFSATSVMDGKRARRTSRAAQFAVAAAKEAVADARLEVNAGNSARVGVVINSAVSGFTEIEQSTRGLLEPRAPSAPPSYFVPSALTNMPACETAMALGAHGPVNASALACASGLYALLEARHLIAAGEADAVVCGGTDAAITEVMFAGLASMGAMSQHNDDPGGASRPFAADRDGFVFGEGAVVLVLESAEHAARRAARPYAVLAGGALTCDAFHISAPDPSAEHATASIRQARLRSGVQPEEIDYICAHGTSTIANDRTETMAIRAALGPAADRVMVSAPKSMVGHLIGAAGALGAMICALAIRDQVAPPTINLNNPDPLCDLDYVPLTARRSPIRVAATSAFGFGGQNCTAVFTAPDLAP